MRVVGTLLILISSAAVFAGVPADSVIEVTGKVINEETSEPVKATIFYESQPYGSEIGEITAAENGEFTIYLLENRRYVFRVDAEGFFPYTESMDIARLLADGAITREIALKTGGPGTIIRLDKLIFAQGSSEITQESFAQIDEIYALMLTSNTMEIQLEGHTDFRGSADANMLLSQNRVNAVKQYLVEKGIPGARIKTRAFGGTQPLSRDNTQEARSQNRRVEVRILKN